MKKIVILLFFLFTTLIYKNYFTTNLSLKSEKNHYWVFETSQNLSFLRFIKGEVTAIGRELRDSYKKSFNFLSKKNNFKKDTLVFYLEKKTYGDWLNFQNLNLKTSMYKSQIYHKKKFKALFLNSIKDTSKVQFRNVGMNMDHYQNFDGFTSFKVKFGKTNNPFGKKAKKNILRLATRNNGVDHFSNIVFNTLGNGILIDYKPVVLNINGKYYNNHIMEDAFDKYLIEKNSRREGSIFEVSFNGSFNEIKKLNQKELFFDYNYKSNDTLFTDNIIKKINKGIIPIEQIDVELFDLFILICYDFFGAHPAKEINLHWYHNPVTNLIEPTIREVEMLDSENVLELPFIKEYLNQTNLDFDNLRKKYYNSKNINEIKKTLLNKNHIDLDFANNVLKKMKDFSIDNFNSKLNSDFNIKKDTIIWDSKINIKSNFILNKNSVLILKDGANIKVNDSVKIKINGLVLCQNNKNINFEGTETSSIYFNSTYNTVLQNIHFKGFGNLNDNSTNHYLPSAITFYETNVTIRNCKFSKNIIGDDFINFFRCPSVLVDSSIFENVYADAIDSDFSNININNTSFYNIGNDAVDCSGSNLEISNSKFVNVQDKCVSAGESTKAIVSNSSFIDSAIALVSKDGSSLTSSNINFEGNNLDVTSFRKKLEYKLSEIYIFSSNNKKNLIEIGVNTNIKSKKVDNVIDDMYGKKYGKATEK